MASHENPRKRAVFLDRDGTLNEDPGYLDDPDKLKLLPTVVDALRLLREKGFTLVVVTNQSGVGRGLIHESTLKLIHLRLNELLGVPNPMVAHFMSCVHRPDDRCECRKPKPKLLLDAAREHGFDLSRSFMVGDKLSDLSAGKNAGCQASVLVRTGNGLDTEMRLRAGEADFVASTLQDAARWIASQD